jgi:hypothetical protein
LSSASFAHVIVNLHARLFPSTLSEYATQVFTPAIDGQIPAPTPHEIVSVLALNFLAALQTAGRIPNNLLHDRPLGGKIVARVENPLSWPAPLEISLLMTAPR